MKIAHVHMHDIADDHRVRRAAVYNRHFQNHEVSLWSFIPSQEHLVVAGRPLHSCPHYLFNDLAAEALPELIFDQDKPDVIVAHEVDALLALVFVFNRVERVQKVRGMPIHEIQPSVRKPPCKLVYDAPEYEPDRPIYGSARSMIETAKKDRAWLEQAALHAVDAATAPCGPIAQHLAELGAKHTYVVTNAPYAPPENSLPEKDNEYIAAYSGIPCFNRDFTAWFEFCRAEEWPLRIFGDASRLDELYVEYVKHYGGEFRGTLPHWYPDQPVVQFEGTLLHELARCSLGFVGGHIKYKNHLYMLPNKMFEYAFAGVPFVWPDWMSCISDCIERTHGSYFHSRAGGLTGLALASSVAEKLPRSFTATQSYDVGNGPVWQAVLDF